MRKPRFTIFWVISSFILLFACSGEDTSGKPVRDKAVVKKSISKPVGESAHKQGDAPSEKEGDRDPAVQIQMALDKSGSRAAGTEPARGQMKSGTEAGQRTDARSTSIRAVPKAPSGLSVTTPGPEETRIAPTPKLPRIAAAPEEARIAPSTERSKGSYLVNRGDTLAGVSGRREVYGDRLKWPILYRVNAESLESLPAADNLPDLQLPDGMKLKTVTDEEKNANLEQRSGNIWVVNVLSAKTSAEAIPAVISLIRNGYPVYLVQARVNEKEWIRVRVGFFRTKEQAEVEGKKIREMLNFQDSWVTRLARSEFMEFAGF
ncbi:MAG: SPOR domain-containing protein [Desulfobacteraceae bacterium]|nr:MAG: SPOR domain-containing protein [Desulfobacteraceae bacterium]